jgi:CRISPR/Cas system-associated exonuclease Cas4 (RecB family)
MRLPDDFTFSQSSLQDYVDCPRRFELRYIEGIRYPSLEAQPALKHEEHMRQGAQFHKMVQQYLVGVPADRLATSVSDNEILSAWWETFTASGLRDLPEQRHAEVTLETTIGDYQLIAKYDLLAIDPDGRALIVDWKTSHKIPRKNWLEKRLQTTVYRYVLAQAGAHLYDNKLISPEQISMTYWFVGHDGKQVTFEHSAEQMQTDEADLLKLINDIASSNLFPLANDTRHCTFCTYRSLCNRGETAGQWDDFETGDDIDEGDGFDVDFDQIAEIEF